MADDEAPLFEDEDEDEANGNVADEAAVELFSSSDDDDDAPIGIIQKTATGGRGGGAAPSVPLARQDTMERQRATEEEEVRRLQNRAIRPGSVVTASRFAFGNAFAAGAPVDAAYPGSVEALEADDDDDEDGRVWRVRYDDDGKCYPTAEKHLTLVSASPPKRRRANDSDDDDDHVEEEDEDEDEEEEEEEEDDDDDDAADSEPF